MDNLKARNLITSTFAENALENLKVVISPSSVTGKTFVAVQNLSTTRVSIYEVNRTKSENELKLISTLTLSLESDYLIGVFHGMDDEKILIVTGKGEICSLSLERFDQELVGNTSDGIKSVACSSDGESLLILTSSNVLLRMNSLFDIVFEAALDVGNLVAPERANIGWGKKETQFHGSVGKQAAKEELQTTNIGSLLDEKHAYIVWRPDCTFFAVNIFDSQSLRRYVLVFNSEGTLESKSEPVKGLEGALAWKPYGGLLACSQRVQDNLEVAFFEKNGLKHGSFRLYGDLKNSNVNKLEWNTNGTMLLVVLKNLQTENCSVQVWTTSNYHFYLKWSLLNSQYNVCNACWDQEAADLLHLTIQASGTLHYLTMTLSTEITRPVYSTQSESPVAVICGETLHYTPFKRRHVPPPLSADNLKLGAPITSISFCPDNDKRMAVLTENNLLHFIECDIKNNGRFACIQLEKTLEKPLGDEIGVLWYAVHMVSNGNAVIFGHSMSSNSSEILLYDCSCDIFSKVSIPEQMSIVEFSNGLHNQLTLLNSFDEVFSFDAESLSFVPNTSVPSDIERFEFCGSMIYCLSKRHVLYCEFSPICQNATSFIVTGNFVVFTTLDHYLNFYGMKTKSILNESRRVERGSKIVTAVHDDAGIILQHPRGNLESVRPRPLVHSMVKRLMSTARFAEALQLCRKDRLDMNILYNGDIDQFLGQVPAFVKAVLSNPDHLSLFLTSLSSKCAFKNRICHSFRAALESIEDMDANDNYVSVYLSTFACADPPELEQAMRTIQLLKKKYNRQKAETALKYLAFLSDSKKLFNIALGLYDLDLTVMVAQHAQMDPREYGPFIKQFESQTFHYQRFSIDKYLLRYTLALSSLILSDKESDEFSTVKSFVQKHNLYGQAVAEYEAHNIHDKACIVKRLWAEELEQRGNLVEAGILYHLVSDHLNARDCWVRSAEWELALSLYPKESLDYVQDILDVLKDEKRFSDASKCANFANVIAGGANSQEFIKDAFETACSSANWNEVIRLAYYYNLNDKLQFKLKEAVESYINEVRDINSTLIKARERLAIVRQRRRSMSEKDNIAASKNAVIDDIDMFSDTESMATTAASTFFTRTSTVASTATSKSKMTGKARRKMERKKYSAKEGGAYEEDYLVDKISKTCKTLTSLISKDGGQGEICSFLKALALSNNIADGSTLQILLVECLEEAQKCIKVAFDDAEVEAMDQVNKMKTDMLAAAGTNDSAMTLLRLMDSLLAFELAEIQKRKNLTVKPDLPKTDCWKLDVFQHCNLK